MYNPRITTWLLLVAVRALQGAETAGQSKWKERFDAAWSQAQAAQGSLNWDEAVKAYGRVLQLVPHEITMLFARAAANARLGHTDDALADLSEAVEYGWNDFERLQSEPAFTALRDDPRFKKIVEQSRRVDAERIAMYVPQSVDCTKAAPLIIAFHGRGENPRFFIATWKAAAERLGAVVVAPRGVRPGGNKLLNVWESADAAKKHDASDVDLPACRKLADEAMATARGRCKIDERRVVLAGYSQGGAVALRLLADDPKRYAGAFAAASLYRSPGVDAWRLAARQRRIYVYLLAGELDEITRYGRQAADELRKAGVETLLTIAPAVGHEPPEDYENKQVEGVRFVLQQAIDPPQP